MYLVCVKNTPENVEELLKLGIRFFGVTITSVDYIAVTLYAKTGSFRSQYDFDYPLVDMCHIAPMLMMGPTQNIIYALEERLIKREDLSNMTILEKHMPCLE